ncbi:MAG: hypothetical protein CL840_19065 [Crocinitomicaceae bacterium]|nr:hypothetical protein [Crocinitomicaceae bacterium]|tara:strand:- start:11308 stop:12282 length:975 start_codon:yes stop_codon:yes gene_type:complete
MQVGKYIIWCLIGVLSSACFKEDMPVTPIEPGDIETVQIEMGYPYKYQVYYDCGANRVVKTNSRYDWDLAFESSPEGFRVFLNTAKGEFLAQAGEVSFGTVNSTKNLTWLWDAPSGNLDSTSVGDWRGKRMVYVLDRQYDANGNHLGYFKFQVLSVNENIYKIRFSDLQEEKGKEFTIRKNHNLSVIHFSMNNGGELLELEPERNSWDLLFTNHYHKFSNLPMPFVLTQVLSNYQNRVVVAEDLKSNFEGIRLSDTTNYTFTAIRDEIGYDWKIRNSQDNSFIIDSKKSFIIKSTKGIYYKIQFTDFYNDQGVKGYPKFKIQRL